MKASDNYLSVWETKPANVIENEIELLSRVQEIHDKYLHRDILSAESKIKILKLLLKGGTQ